MRKAGQRTVQERGGRGRKKDAGKNGDLVFYPQAAKSNTQYASDIMDWIFLLFCGEARVTVTALYTHYQSYSI